MASIGTTLERYKGLGPGFDFMRIGLATAILMFHCFLLTGNRWVFQGPAWIIEYSLVPMFFALSGFLIAASAMRLSLKNFLINRALRILPALAVDVVVCALVIGPLETTIPLSEYFRSPGFYKYFLNMMGYIHFFLPGVFVHQAEAAVNASLWTVPYEMLCYVVMSAFILTRFITKPAFVMAVVLGILIGGLLVEKYGGYVPYYPRRVMQEVVIYRGSQCMLAFILGILAYQIRHAVPYSKWTALACVLVCLAGALRLDLVSSEIVIYRFMLLPALVYLTVYLGVTRIPIPRILHSGDYSYGVYLYHAPLLKVVVGLVPGIVLTRFWGAIALALLTLPAVALLAAFSWHVIEKPVLGLRKRFSFVARVRGVASGSDATIAPVLQVDASAQRVATCTGATSASVSRAN